MRKKILFVVLAVSILIMSSYAMAVKPESPPGMLNEKNDKAPGHWKKNIVFESQQQFVSEIHREISWRLEQHGVFTFGLIKQIDDSLPPVAIITCETLVYTKTPVIFTADESYDPDGGNIILIEWDVHSNEGYEIVDVDQYIEVYDYPGTYQIGLRVTDDEEQTGTAIVTVTVIE